MEEKVQSQVKMFFASTMGRVVVTVVSMVIIYGVLFLCLESSSTVVLGITLAVCGYFGWKALNKITPDIFLFMSIGGWAIYFLIKGLLSIMIGAFIAPFQIGKMISTAVSNSVSEE